MFQKFLILLFPLVVFGQRIWPPESPVVTDQLCQEEYDKIIGCVRTPLFAKIDDMPLPDPIKNQELVNEITHVLDCSRLLYCNSSRILQSYISNQRWISDHFHATLSDCLTFEAERKIIEQCGGIEELQCDLFNESNLLCHLTELEKQPNCTERHVEPYVRLYTAIRSSCVMGIQWRSEMDRHHIKEKRTI
ncbi:hypothetical protein B9Z55_012447 [Caenorhabditis nigoni]|uniref:DUF19 domain-containing protein n=1 Tax=Caenorhabditis nigoni TaxID=1611254 RepID=A0A2G5TXA5_9PELO|nr:hypothetical protein B9Z55_012447 [Caenorhabditis nigoni]